MNVFRLGRAKTSERLVAKGKCKMVTSGYAGDFTRGSKRDPKAKCLSVLTLLMALSVWVFGAIGSTNPGFARLEEIGAGLFIISEYFSCVRGRATPSE